MRYFNQKGERVSNSEIQTETGNKPITGWAIDVEGLSHEDMDTFLRLWKKGNFTPLYRNQQEVKNLSQSGE